MNLKSVTDWIKKIVVITGIIIAFVSVVEIFHIYNVLNTTNPIFGKILLFFVGLGTLYIIYIATKLFLFKTPPLVSPIKELSKDLPHSKFVEYYEYLFKYLNRLLKNKNLSDNIKDNLKQKCTEYKSGKNKIDYDLLVNMETNLLQPVLKELDKIADDKITGTVRDIVIGVTISPYNSIDAFIVILRMVHLVWQIVQIYVARPTFTETYKLIKSIATGIFTVTVLNFAEKPIEHTVGKFLPFIGNVVGDITQGLTAGYYVYTAGNIAKEKCRGYKIDGDIRKSYGLGLVDIIKSVPDIFTTKIKKVISIPNFIKEYIKDWFIDYAVNKSGFTKELANENFDYIISGTHEKLDNKLNNILYMKYIITQNKDNDNYNLTFIIYILKNDEPLKTIYKNENIPWEKLSSDIRNIFIVEASKKVEYEIYKKVR